MRLPFFIANRYIKSKSGSKFISLVSVISIIGITLGVAVVIIALTILDGFENTVTQKIIEFNSHIKITAFGNRNLPDYETEIPQIKKVLGGEIKSISPFVSKLSIIRSKKFSEGISLLGVRQDEQSENISRYIISGKFDLRPEGDTIPIVLGKKLADKLLVNSGSRVTIFSLRNDKMPSMENPPSIQQFTVAGIYESGMSEYDDLNAYVDLDFAQNLFGMGKDVSGYNIQLKDISKIDSASVALQDNLRYPYYVRSIFKVHQNIFTWLDLQKEPIPIILGLIIFVAVFNVIGTLLMIVLERTSDIGILKSLGGTRSMIIRIFLLQGSYLSLIGLFAGNLLALLLSILQKEFNLISLPGSVYFVSSVPVSIEPFNYLLVSVATMGLCILAALIPSYIASKIKPISAIRFE